MSHKDVLCSGGMGAVGEGGGSEGLLGRPRHGLRGFCEATASLLGANRIDPTATPVEIPALGLHLEDVDTAATVRTLGREDVLVRADSVGVEETKTREV